MSSLRQKPRKKEMLRENLNIFIGGEFSQPASVNGIPTYGIFDEYHSDSFGFGDSVVSDGNMYCFTIRTEDAAGLHHGDPVEIPPGGRLFEIVGIKGCPPDRLLTNLILKES